MPSTGFFQKPQLSPALSSKTPFFGDPLSPHRELLKGLQQKDSLNDKDPRGIVLATTGWVPLPALPHRLPTHQGYLLRCVVGQHNHTKRYDIILVAGAPTALIPPNSVDVPSIGLSFTGTVKGAEGEESAVVKFIINGSRTITDVGQLRLEYPSTSR